MGRNRLTLARQNHIEEPTINLTPLIDVVFVILIMFILIAPLLELDQIELADGPHLQTSQAQTVQESSPIAIHVHKDNTVFLNNHVVTTVQLTEQLKEAKIKYPKIVPQVFHDRNAHFGTYQSVKNALEEAGFSQMEIILKPA